MQARRQRISDFVAAGGVPRTTGSGAVIARSGPGHQTLVSNDGTLTAVGAYYEQVSGTTLPVGGFDTSQAPVREGDTEYISLRGGERKAVRRWDPAAGDYRFTALGKSYYSRLRRNYLVQVPVNVSGVRKNGTQYQIRSSLPVAKLGIDRVTLPLNLTAAQRTQRVKEMVRAQLDLTQPLYEVSKETWSFDETSDGAWTIHEETVGIDPDSG